MRSAQLEIVARDLGFALKRNGSGWHCSPCPACGRERRNGSTPSERRGALQLSTDRGWYCFPCETSGDAIDLVAYRLGGRRYRELPDHRRREVAEWCSGHLGLGTGSSSFRPAPRLPAPERDAAPAQRLPVHELKYLFNKVLVPVVEDPEALAYCERRRIDPVTLDDCRLACVLPRGVSLPRWARGPGGTWSETNHRLVIPFFDTRGELASCEARSLCIKPALGKTMFPRGSRQGTVMACLFGRAILKHGGPAPLEDGSQWWDPSKQLEVWIHEGGSDFLIAAAGLNRPDSDANPYAPAIFGIESGSWTEELAARIPDGAHVVIATDNDETGEKYAERIMSTFAGRNVKMGRWRPCLTKPREVA